MFDKINTALLATVLGVLVYSFFVRAQPGRYKPLDSRAAAALARETWGKPALGGTLILDTRTGRVCDSRTPPPPLSAEEQELQDEANRITQELRDAARKDETLEERLRRLAIPSPTPAPSIPFCSELK